MKIIVVAFIVIVFVLFTFGIVPLILMTLWNFIISYFHHPELKITFWIALAIAVLLSIIGSFFKKGSNKK